MNWTGQQAEPLVRIKGESPLMPPNDFALDPHLAIHGHSSLLLSHISDLDSALHYLSHRIVRQPRELRSHVQRIFLLIRQEDGASLYGALVDLLIVLGSKGRALKHRMLGFARPLLNPNSLDFLQQRLDQGIIPGDPAISRMRSSLLRFEFCAIEPLVVLHKTQKHAQARSSLEEARELIEYGQLEQALETLENALLVNPDQSDVADQLWELYRRMGELNRMEALREQLLINFGRVPEV